MTFDPRLVSTTAIHSINRICCCCSRFRLGERLSPPPPAPTSSRRQGTQPLGPRRGIGINHHHSLRSVLSSDGTRLGWVSLQWPGRPGGLQARRGRLPLFYVFFLVSRFRISGGRAKLAMRYICVSDFSCTDYRWWFSNKQTKQRRRPFRSLGEQAEVGVLQGRRDLDAGGGEQSHVDLVPRHHQVPDAAEPAEPAQLQELHATSHAAHPVLLGERERAGGVSCRYGVRWCSTSCPAGPSLLYLENRVAEPDPPELLLFRVLRYVGHNLEQYLAVSQLLRRYGPSNRLYLRLRSTKHACERCAWRFRSLSDAVAIRCVTGGESVTKKMRAGYC